jgi:hypothetical protein
VEVAVGLPLLWCKFDTSQATLKHFHAINRTGRGNSGIVQLSSNWCKPVQALKIPIHEIRE